MSMREYVREHLREAVLEGVCFVESKSSGADEWWDGLSGKKARQVVAILGLNKKRYSVPFSELSQSEQAEIRAYFRKHKGKVEDTDLDADVL